jgi:hypothetical protein
LDPRRPGWVDDAAWWTIGAGDPALESRWPLMLALLMLLTAPLMFAATARRD